MAEALEMTVVDTRGWRQLAASLMLLILAVRSATCCPRPLHRWALRCLLEAAPGSRQASFHALRLIALMSGGRPETSATALVGSSVSSFPWTRFGMSGTWGARGCYSHWVTASGEVHVSLGRLCLRVASSVPLVSAGVSREQSRHLRCGISRLGSLPPACDSSHLGRAS